jgi:hypothetical protein
VRHGWGIRFATFTGTKIEAVDHWLQAASRLG